MFHIEWCRSSLFIDYFWFHGLCAVIKIKILILLVMCLMALEVKEKAESTVIWWEKKQQQQGNLKNKNTWEKN